MTTVTQVTRSNKKTSDFIIRLKGLAVFVVVFVFVMLMLFGFVMGAWPFISYFL